MHSFEGRHRTWSHDLSPAIIVQSEVAKQKALTFFISVPKVEDFTPLAIDQFFDEPTIAVYLKERAKGQSLVRVRSRRLRHMTLRDQLLHGIRSCRMIATGDFERAKRDPDGFY
jgi:ATPase